MTDHDADRAEEHPVLLSSESAGASERRIALAFVAASVVIFLIVAPLTHVQLPRVWAFIPSYQSALVVNDLITAIFLYGQFGISRARPMLLLASGYLFTACMATAHALSFPDLFAPFGLLGGGAQTTAWLYMFWHTGFPLLVIAYARARRDGQAAPESSRIAILSSITAVGVATLVCTLVATAGNDVIPPIMQGNQKAPGSVVILSTVLLLNIAALVALWRRKPHSVLDLWLMVVMCAWFFDVALSAVLNAGRFDLGFYVGRIYGLLAASFVLAVLLLENSRLYGLLVATSASDRRKSIELHRLSTMDPLTRIPNRRAFETALDREWRRARRHGTALSLLMVDVDFFKGFNDEYGHVAGDACLRAIAGALADNTKRAEDLAARFGGEEFAVLLPHTAPDDAQRLARRACAAVRDLNVPHEKSLISDRVTVSIGVASMIGAAAADVAANDDGRPSADPRRGPAHLVEAADRALYAAKEAGRNRVWSAPVEAGPLTPAEMPLVRVMHRTA